MPEMHLDIPMKPGYAYSVSGSLTKTKERILEFKKTGDSRFIC